MKKFFTILTILTFPLTVLATGQSGDILIWKGDTLTVFSNPLELREDIDSIRPKLFGDKEAGVNTACWRGYIAEWEIIDNELYLTNIFSCNYKQDSIKADLANLFSSEYNSGKVKANWVTGKLLVPKGKLIHYIHKDYDSFYEIELVLTFDKGKLIDQKEYDNSRSHKSIFTKNPDSLQKFIYSNINWKIIPDLKDEEVKVLISIQSGAIPKPDSVTIVRRAKDEIFNSEALRVVKMLPDWDVYYSHGEIYPMKWMLLIVFDEEKRKKYTGSRNN